MRRFSDFREITAKFPSTGKCGHDIKAGERIGYNRRDGVYCPKCWDRWVRENQSADEDERFYQGQY